MKQDNQIFELIGKERERQLHGIELIASENFVSEQVMAAMGSVLTNKYAEGYPAARYYGGCEVVDEVEKLAIERLCKLYGAEYANVQPHSGAQANMAVFFAVLQSGDTFMGLDLAHGGHLSHGSPVNMSGKYFNAIGYQLNEQTGTIDYDDMERKAMEHKPKLIVGGASAYGGIGTVPGVIIGALLMGIINQGMSIMGVDANYQKVVKGLVLLAAVIFDVVTKKSDK